VYQIDNSTAVPVEPPRPEASTPGYFTGGIPGDPANPATIVPHWWLNMLQNEMLNVITAASLVPDKSDDTQFAQAVAIQAGSVPSGTVNFTIKTVEPAGYLFMNGRTIGKTGSGADLESDFYEPLYTDLYGLDDLYAPVIGGRSGNAAADFDAGKPITLLAATGRALIGAGLGAGLTIDHPLGSLIGTEDNTQTTAQVGNHRHDINARSGSNNGGSIITSASQNVTTQTKVTEFSGAAEPMNNIQPSLALNIMIKI
jgi:hypothetical protein